MTNLIVSTINLRTKTGKHIRKATKVTWPDGRSIWFMELLPKGKAIQAALKYGPTDEAPA